MTLNIRFNDGAPPKQYQHVRMYTVYPQQNGRSEPQIVVHFYDNLYPQMNIAMHRIESVTTFND